MNPGVIPGDPGVGNQDRVRVGASRALSPLAHDNDSDIFADVVIREPASYTYQLTPEEQVAEDVACAKVAREAAILDLLRSAARARGAGMSDEEIAHAIAEQQAMGMTPEEIAALHDPDTNEDAARVKADYASFREAKRRAGLLIDPKTAEVTCSYRYVLDPYDFGLEVEPEGRCVGKEWFARSPGGEWVWDGDLPASTIAYLCEHEVESIDPFPFDDDDVATGVVS
jgi:hypothetical protein